MKASRLIQFYLGEIPNSSGRTISEILNFTHQQQEAIHDYIQWLFPLQEPSAFNPQAPVLSPQDIQTFRGSEVLRKQLLEALQKMLAFYGLEIQGSRIVRSAAWEQSKGWLTPHNHNYLRITRILTCLGLLGLEDYARAFFVALQGVYQDYGGRIGPETWGFWAGAVPQHPVGGP
jgi:hypothetical protein